MREDSSSQWMLGKLLSFRGIMQPLECNPAAKVKQMDASTAESGIVQHQCVLKTTHYCLICSALSAEYS